jgi:hypothetical protein
MRVNLVRPNLVDDSKETGITFERGGMQVNASEDMPDPPKSMFRVFDRDSADNAVHFVALLKE